METKPYKPECNLLVFNAISESSSFGGVTDWVGGGGAGGGGRKCIPRNFGSNTSIIMKPGKNIT